MYNCILCSHWCCIVLKGILTAFYKSTVVEFFVPLCNDILANFWLYSTCEQVKMETIKLPWLHLIGQLRNSVNFKYEYHNVWLSFWYHRNNMKQKVTRNKIIPILSSPPIWNSLQKLIIVINHAVITVIGCLRLSLANTLDSVSAT